MLDSRHVLLARGCRLDFAAAGSCIGCLTGLVLRLGLVVGRQARLLLLRLLLLDQYLFLLHVVLVGLHFG